MRNPENVLCPQTEREGGRDIHLSVPPCGFPSFHASIPRRRKEAGQYPLPSFMALKGSRRRGNSFRVTCGEGSITQGRRIYFEGFCGFKAKITTRTKRKKEVDRALPSIPPLRCGSFAHKKRRGRGIIVFEV